MGNFSFVLTNELYKEYHLFKKQEKFDKDIISNLLKFHCGEFLTNTKQLEDIGIDQELEKTTYISLKKGGNTNQSLEELANKTDYKMILSKDKSDFPYVNIFSEAPTEAICSHIVGCYYRNESRDKAIKHIKSLCQKADKICIADEYLSKGSLSIDALKSILPTNRKVDIIYHPRQIISTDITNMQGENGNWNFVADSNLLINSHHDRYIIIDDKMEIILTSGFEYLVSNAKELSYVVRPISRNRLLNS